MQNVVAVNGVSRFLLAQIPFLPSPKAHLLFFLLGLHAESSVFTTIYGLLFWDVIYMPDIPDTFYNLHQYQPLDFQTDLFYERRREMLDKQLNVLRNSSEEVNSFTSTHKKKKQKSAVN